MITERMWYYIILNLSTFTAIDILHYGATLHTQQFQLLIFAQHCFQCLQTRVKFLRKKKIQCLKVQKLRLPDGAKIQPLRQPTNCRSPHQPTQTA
jgi:hypothetical protein